MRYAHWVGRVGALALFLGVGTVISVSGIAHAEADSDSSASRPAVGSPHDGSRAQSRESRGRHSAQVATPSRSSEVRQTQRLASARPNSRPSARESGGRGVRAPGRSDAPHRAVRPVPSTDVATGPVSSAPRVTTDVTTTSQVAARSTLTRSAKRQAPPVDISHPSLVTLSASVNRRDPAWTVAPTAVPVSKRSVPHASATSQRDTSADEPSPLATPGQLKAEKIAERTARSLPVRLMKVVLTFQFRAAVHRQFASVGGPDAANLELLDDAVDQFARFSSFTQQLLNPMAPEFIWADNPPHTWFGAKSGDSRYLYDNPDTIYRFTGVNRNASYVITGRFDNYDPQDPAGTLPADTTFSVVEGTSGTTSSILSAEDMEIAADGSFVITVSGEPSGPGQTNHIQLTSNSTVLLARNTLGNWNVEEPMSLSIQKISGPRNSLFAQLGGFAFLGARINDNPLLVRLVSLVPPSLLARTPLVRGGLTAVIMLVRGANEQEKYMALANTDPVTGEQKPVNVIPQPSSNAEFLANQRQSIATFRLADDQALVLTIDPGSADYFTVPVYSDWTTTTDFWNQQTSLNNEQARRNPDGTYTVVISPTDTGAYNWISTGGLNQGIIAARFQLIDPDSPAMPRIVSQQVVPLSEVAALLPNDPMYFATEEQRAEQIALRVAGYAKRFAPYPQA
ncbi:DUF1214 domain-containing protein [Mycolicibacterium sp. 3033]|nr:DUF1214 domain-containing protein [Mycolicibacterium aurantiacum]